MIAISAVAWLSRPCCCAVQALQLEVTEVPSTSAVTQRLPALASAAQPPGTLGIGTADQQP